VVGPTQLQEFWKPLNERRVAEHRLVTIAGIALRVGSG